MLAAKLQPNFRLFVRIIARTYGYRWSRIPEVQKRGRTNGGAEPGPETTTYVGRSGELVNSISPRISPGPARSSSSSSSFLVLSSTPRPFAPRPFLPFISTEWAFAHFYSLSRGTSFGRLRLLFLYTRLDIHPSFFAAYSSCRSREEKRSEGGG